MSIYGTVRCDGPAEVFGRIKGTIHASEIAIAAGAYVEGRVSAQQVTIQGRVQAPSWPVR